jgi:hypothetical protein
VRDQPLGRVVMVVVMVMVVAVCSRPLSLRRNRSREAEDEDESNQELFHVGLDENGRLQDYSAVPALITFPRFIPGAPQRGRQVCEPMRGDNPASFLALFGFLISFFLCAGQFLGFLPIVGAHHIRPELDDFGTDDSFDRDSQSVTDRVTDSTI